MKTLPTALAVLAVLFLAPTHPLAAQDAAGEKKQAEQPKAEEPSQDAPNEEKKADEGVSFANEVAPIFVRKCMACHGNQQSKGGFNLTTFESLMRPGNSAEPSVTPGDPDASHLLLLVEAGEMPQDADPLPEEQVELIRRWIDEGAKFDGPSPSDALSTMIPKGVNPPAPEVYRVPVPITALAFKPGGAQLAVGGYHEILLRCRECGHERRLGNVAERTYSLAFSPDGKLLASGSGTPAQVGEVKLWNPKTGEVVKDLLTTSDSVFCVAFSPDGKRLAAGGADRAIRVWNVETGEQQLLIEDHADWVMSVAWSPDGSKLVSASRDKTSKVFDTASGDSIVTFPGHGEPVFAAAFSPDGKLVASAGRDKQVRLWNPADAKQARAIGGHANEIYNVIYATEGPTLFTTSADKTVRQFNPGNGSQVRSFEGHTDYIYSAALSPNTHELATGDWRGEVRIWNTQDGSVVERFIAAPGYKEPTTVAQAQ
jgi:mono/diheme cytochrome c family protein